MTCFCCVAQLIRAGELPDARWLRPGDRYCANCRFIIAREQLEDGWPRQRRPCPAHGEAGTEAS